MAIDQLKGAAGVEFLTYDLSSYTTLDDTSFKVGLVGWTAQGPSNQVVSITNTNQLYSIFGTPSKNAKNNQLLYSAKMLLDTGATLRIVRTVETVEKLDAVSFKIPDHSVLDYDTILSGGMSGTTSGTNVSYEAVYTGYTAQSNSLSDVVTLLKDNIEISPNIDSNNALTIATKYPGFKGYYVSLQTYSFFDPVKETTPIGSPRSQNIDTLTSRHITEDVEFTSMVMNEGLYDPTLDRYDPTVAFTYEDDNGLSVNALGAFLRYNTESGEWAINQELSTFLNIFGIIRVYASATATSPIQTIPFTRINYVNSAGVQLLLDETTKKNSIVVGKVNESFNRGWKNITPYTLSITSGRVSSKITKVPLMISGLNPTAPNAIPDYATAWELFKDVSKVSVNLLCSAGTSVKGFGDKIETLEIINTSVISKMLEVCTVRKDCIAIFDLPKRKDIEALIKDVELYVPSVGQESGGSNATFETFWGAMYDGRQLMFDRYNKKDVEVAMTSFVAQNITNIWTKQYPWYIPAGTSRGAIGYPSNGNVYIRKYPDDVGALTQARINTTRSLDGQFLWGEATLQRKATSLNRLHAASLLAYLYGRLRKMLTPFVYELNTPELRKTIREEITTLLEFIKIKNGLYNFVVICDDTNNTPNVIDNNQLLVDIGIEITKGAERITVRNTVYRTNGLIEAGLL